MDSYVLILSSGSIAVFQRNSLLQCLIIRRVLEKEYIISNFIKMDEKYVYQFYFTTF